MTNPVLERELIDILRTRRAFAMQLGVASLFAALILLRWPSDGQADLSGIQAEQMFRTFGYGLLLVTILLVPAFPATTLVRERHQGTLALLLHSPLEPWRIYGGKLAGVMGFILLPLLMTLPAAMACYAMGGLSLGENLLALYAVVVLASLQYAALGLWVGSMARSTDSALRITYALVFVVTILVLGPYQFLQGQPGELLVWSSVWLRSVSPIPAVMEIVGQGQAASEGLLSPTGNLARYALTALVTTAGLAGHTLWRLNPLLFDQARSSGVMTEERSVGQRWLRRFLFLIDPQRRTGLIGPWTNPVLVKEFRSRRFGRSTWMVRLIAGSAVVSLGLTYTSTTGTMDWGPETIGGIMVVLQGTLILLLIPGLAAGLISSERETGGWPLLQMTPLTTGQILRGKLLSVTWTVSLILLATLPGYLVMMAIQPSLSLQIFYVLGCLLSMAVFAVVFSAAIGSLFRRTAPATVTSYGLLAFFCGGVFLVWLERDSTFDHATTQWLLALNPMAAALAIMEVPGFTQYNLFPLAAWSISAAITASLLLLTAQTWRLSRPR
ncbi:MAG: ABC transporter permease subunit [Pirellulaceae bacterium]